MTEYGTTLPDGMVLPPLRGPGNNYTFIEARVGSVEPNFPISIVIPVYNRIEMLRRTMGMLTHQTYPLDLIEVVIADDGSSDHPEQLIDEFSPFFEVNYVRQQDLGYRLSHARNLGVRAARHDHVIILDCDMAPVPGLVKTYAEWLAVGEKVILIGHRRYVDANNVDPSAVLEDPTVMMELPNVQTKNAVMKNSPSSDWREPIYEATDYLKQSPHPFRCCSCGNVAFHRRLFQEAGSFDEAFTAWGAEDNEFGYRVWNAGYYFIPMLDALGMHQEPPGGREFVDREAGRAITKPMLLDKVPAFYRTYDPEVETSVPAVSIYIPAYNAANTIEQAIDSALAQTYRDFEIVVCNDGSTDRTRAILNQRYGQHPKIKILHQENAGIGAASNAAISAAAGMYILHLDADDVLEPTAIEVLLPELEARPDHGCVYGSYFRFESNLEERTEGWSVPNFNRIRMMYGMMVHPPRLFRKREWSRVGGFDTSMANAVDYDFYLRLSAISKLHHVDSFLYNYRIHAASTSHVYASTQKENTRQIQELHLRSLGLTAWEVVPDLDGHSAKNVKFQRKKIIQQDGLPLVSIVIITKNRAHLLADSIRSCLWQTHSDFEIVVVDDGSTDRTEDVVKSFNDPRIRYIRQDPLGIPFARNKGVQEAVGEWVVIMDDDDLMLPSRIADHLRVVQDGVDGSYGGWIDFDEEFNLDYHQGKKHGYAELLFGGKVLVHAASMIRRSVLLQHPYDERFQFGTDWVMNLSVAYSGHRFAHTKSYVYFRRFHGNNVTSVNSEHQKNASKVIFKEHLARLNDAEEEKLRLKARNADFGFIVPQPSLDELRTLLPWFIPQAQLGSEERAESSLYSAPMQNLDSYDRSRWAQEGRRLYFDAGTRSVWFTMPKGWSLESTHSDLLRVAHFVLTSPWEGGILDGWIPSRAKGWRPGLAFSGGIDSTAAMQLLPSQTVLLYHEREGLPSVLNHSNAHRFFEALAVHGRPVLRIQSNHESIRTDHGKNPGFSTDLAGAVHVILLADFFDLGGVSMGMPLENAFLFHGWRGRDFRLSTYWLNHSRLLQRAGLDLLLPVAGLSEIINQKIVDASPFADYAQSCLRSTTPGGICGKCWKCFRKNSMKGRPILLTGEIEVFLGTRPLKQAASTLYAIQQLPEKQQAQIHELHPDLMPLLSLDYSFLERFHRGAMDLLPDQYVDPILASLEEISSPMSDEEVERLHDIRLTTTEE
jgi:chondroitin synthase